MNWDDVGDAIQRAIEIAANIGPGKIVWKGQDVGSPILPYVAINIPSIIPMGIDYIQTSQDLGRPRGQEIELRVRGLREVGVEIECFTDSAVTSRSASAQALCSTILARLILPSIRTILAAQDVSFFDYGAPRWIPDVPSTRFRGRAISMVRGYMPPPTAVEYVGYIDRFTGSIIASASVGATATVHAFDSASNPGSEDS